MPSRCSSTGALTVAEAAGVLGVHPVSVRRLVRSGRLEALRIGTAPHGQLRIPAEAIEEFTREARARAVC